MSLSSFDLLILFAYLILTLLAGLWPWQFLQAKPSQAQLHGSLASFFLSNRRLPWWLAGISMAATSFAADTPLWVAGQVAKHGISANWLWWSMAAGGLCTVFFFARLWRRAGVLTDLEFISLRYCGRPASFLRAFRSIYIGFVLNCIVMAWVHLALIHICEALFPNYDAKMIVLFCLLLTLLYISLAGLRGVVVTDFFQFLVAMGGCIFLAYYVWNHSAIGAKAGLQESLGESFFHFLPSIHDASAAEAAERGSAGKLAMGWADFLAYVLLLWWASWYPGSEPGGGGYITQRILSARNEKEGFLAALCFVLVHYCMRSWPWIMAALAAAALYPYLEGAEQEKGFVYLIRDFLPSPMKGLLAAAFLGAYMSTISTHLNWGASYFCNDFYKAFLARDKPKKHYLRAAALFSLMLAVASLLTSLFLLDSIHAAWSLLLECTAGMGFVLLLRWYWWRINAWAEIASMFIPPLIVCFLRLALPYFWHIEAPAAPQSLFIIVPLSLCLTLLVMYLSPAEKESHLRKFYNKIHPAGPGWFAISRKKGRSLLPLFCAWLCALAFTYSLLFAIGSWLLDESHQFWLCFLLCLVCGLLLILLIRREFGREQEA